LRRDVVLRHVGKNHEQEERRDQHHQHGPDDSAADPPSLLPFHNRSLCPYPLCLDELREHFFVHATLNRGAALDEKQWLSITPLSEESRWQQGCSTVSEERSPERL